MRAEVGHPVPGEDALHRHHDVLAVRADRGEQVLGRGRPVAVDQDLALGVEHADVHPPGVQIDSTVVSVRRGVEPHPVSSFPPGGRGVCLAAFTVPRPVAGGGAWMRVITLQRTGARDARSGR